ncbi:MAG: Gfo/Idh/MocA family oxidoreductase, partial [Devosiaceae bacterium]|nr:Gfo/Idh/MocA family oxidoreductase [Devosiaceae bacterium MH13]
MVNAIRWGVLGASNFAREQMAPAIHAAEGADFVALATSSEQKAEAFTAFAPNLHIHQNYDDLLADPKIEAVYIPLPNHMHVDWTKKALDAGKHVLTEKPISLAAPEIDELIKKRDATGLVAAEAYMIVHHPQWQRAKEIYEQGAIGRLQHVDGFFAYNNASDPGNIRNRPESGGGGIRDIGVYTYGSTRWLTGQEPIEVTHTSVDYENDVDVLARVSAKFEGFSAHWVTSMRMHPHQEMTFYGTEGILRLTAPFNANIFGPAVLEVRRNTGGGHGAMLTTERFAAANHYVYQVENFCRSVRGEAAYPWTLEDARGTQ